MRYKIEIWQWHSITETYESDNIENILEWYKVHWRWTYELGNCAFTIYKNNEELSWDEEYELGFHD